MKGRGILASLVILVLLVTSVPLSAVVADVPQTYTGYGYCKTITINPGQVPSEQTDFPVLISISNDVDLKAHVARSDGGDIIFTDVDNTVVYSYEIESYDSSTGTLVAWVKIPSLSDGTIIKMWYGVDTGTPNWDPNGVWDEYFVMVQHMNLEATDGTMVTDSTSYENDGTVEGTADLATVAGVIGNAINFPGAAAYIDCGGDLSLDFLIDGTYTWEAWINPTGFHPGGSGIIGKKQTPNVDHQGYELYCSGSGGAGGGGYQGGFEGDADDAQLRFQSTGGNSSSVASHSVGVGDNEWLHIVVVFNTSSDVSIYMNGNPIQIIMQPSSNTGSSGSLETSNDAVGAEYEDPLFIGWRRSAPAGSDKGFFYGIIDEIEISNTLRSADWIKAGYNNQFSPETFYNISEEASDGSQGPNTDLLSWELISSGGIANIEGIIDNASGKTLGNARIESADGGAIVSIAEGTGISKSSDILGEITFVSTTSKETIVENSRILSAYEFEPGDIYFDSDVILTVKYDQDNIPEGSTASDLMLMVMNEDTGAWDRLDNATINTVNHTISGQIDKLSGVALLVASSTNSTTTVDNTPQEGTNCNIIIFDIVVAVVILSLILARIVINKKKAGKSAG